MSELNLRNERYGKLEYASLHVMEGDITSFLGLNYSGKELAVQILLGEIDLDWNKIRFILMDKNTKGIGFAPAGLSFVCRQSWD